MGQPEKEVEEELVDRAKVCVPSSIVTDVSPLQPEKALSPMDVTLLGMTTDVSPLQPEKAKPPMDVTLLPIETDVRPLQPENALSPMSVTLFPIVNFVNLVLFLNGG